MKFFSVFMIAAIIGITPVLSGCGSTEVVTLSNKNVSANNVTPSNTSSSKLHQKFISQQKTGNPAQMFQKVFASKQIGFGVKNLGGGASNWKYELDKTTDGGKIWTKRGTFKADDLGGISFINQHTGFLLNNSPAYKTTPGLSVTHDGGKSWSAVKLPIPNKYTFKGNHGYIRESSYPIFFAQKVGFIPIFGSKENHKSHFLYMDETHNGGETWHALLESDNHFSWSINKDTLTVQYKTQTAKIRDINGTWKVSIQ